MRIENFAMTVADDIRIILGSEYNIEYKEVNKNNGVTYHALLIKKEGENIAPTIYIDNLFEAYLDGRTQKSIVRDIINMYRESAPRDDFDMSFFTDFSNACKMLAFKVVNYDKNKKVLMGIPYKKVEDLALVPICLVSDDELGDGNITIKNEHLKQWEISFDELWENVWESAAVASPMRCRSMCETLGEMMGEDMSEDIEIPNNIYVVSNSQGVNGAAAFMYPGVLDNLAGELDGDLVILPSSVHEVLVMRKPDEEAELLKLKEIVGEVNESVLKEEDFLSGRIYLYDRFKKSISSMAE